MPMNATTPIWLMVSIIILTLLVILIIGIVTSLYDLRKSRLPDATRHEDLKEKLASIAAQILDSAEVLKQIEQKIHDRDRIAAEVAALNERLGNLRIEYDGLSEAERQIEAMKYQAAEIAETRARESANLESVRKELHVAEEQLVNARQNLSKVELQAEGLNKEIERLRHTLPADIEAIKGELSRLNEEKSCLLNELTLLKGERVSLMAVRDEVAALVTQKAALVHDIETQQTLLREIESGEALSSFETQRSKLIVDIQKLIADRANMEHRNEEVRAIGETIDALTAKKAALEQTIDYLSRASQSKIEEAKVELARLQGEKAAIVNKIDQLRAEGVALEQVQLQVRQLGDTINDLTARRAALEEDIKRLRNDEVGEFENHTVLEDLRSLPLFLYSAATETCIAETENDALQYVGLYLRRLGLKYDARIVAAFHTALKVNETSQMTVLAGVSGTGKSLLPRRYAEAMGLNFLQIAVEPRWDSPQDLLGFYNYIEKRYRGTELARALVQMDPFNTSELAGQPYGDQVLLVLLDEMNLARVEYYFSEFLSRLEVRPRFKDVGDKNRRSGACLPIDIRGRKQGPIQLFPSHNVLFAGTMNDDESTQSLSDKVLDRSNMMQFAAPESFAHPVENLGAARLSGYRSFREWRSWIRSADELIGGERQKTERVVNQLAVLMEQCGRPFGHRLNEAILTYVANYPRQRAESVDTALTDQIEFRILPKLRGLTIQDHPQSFDDLIKLIRDDLRDQAFSQRLGEVVERQRNGTGQFNWRGLNRGQG